VPQSTTTSGNFATTCTWDQENSGTCSIIPPDGDFCSVTNEVACDPASGACPTPVKTVLPNLTDSLANLEFCIDRGGVPRWQCSIDSGAQSFGNTSRRSNWWFWASQKLKGASTLGVKVRAKDTAVKLYVYSDYHYEGDMMVVNCPRGQDCEFHNVSFPKGILSFACQREFFDNTPLATVPIPTKPILDAASVALDAKIAPHAEAYSATTSEIHWVNAQERCAHWGSTGAIYNGQPGCQETSFAHGEMSYLIGEDGENRYRDEILLVKSFNFKPPPVWGLGIPSHPVSLFFFLRPILKDGNFHVELKDVYIRAMRADNTLPLELVGVSDLDIQRKIQQGFLDVFNTTDATSGLTYAALVADMIEKGIYDAAFQQVMAKGIFKPGQEDLAHDFVKNNVLGNKRRLQLTYTCDGSVTDYRSDVVNANAKDCGVTSGGTHMEDWSPRIILNYMRTLFSF
jgi:hypothetical protein